MNEDVKYMIMLMNNIRCYSKNKYECAICDERISCNQKVI